MVHIPALPASVVLAVLAVLAVSAVLQEHRLEVLRFQVRVFGLDGFTAQRSSC